MALRLIEMVVQKKDFEHLHQLFKKHEFLEYKELTLSNGEILIRILLNAEQNEGVLDLLEKYYSNKKENRVVILPVEATLPRIEEESPANGEEKSQERVSREELYEDIRDSATCSWVYLGMIVLSTIVGTIGLQNNNVAIIIGAMVIAPMLGPSIALALATTLGDLKLLRRAILTGLAGIGTAIVLSMIIGFLVQVDATAPEIALRTRVQLSDIIVALASGCAGALSFTAGTSATLIGVMVAVALLPPLVASGLLLGSGQVLLALNAGVLFLTNLVCVNIAGVSMFLIQGIHPGKWWEEDRAQKATYIAIGLWVVTLVALLLLILFF